jgi:hypothetical protein
MDDVRFDRLARTLDGRRSRRAATALLGGLLATPLLASDESAAKKKKRKKKCKPGPAAQTCAGKCGSVRNRCKKMVDCGPCTPPCTGLQPTADLQAAINAAAPGSTLTLCAGTWTAPAGSLSISKSLTLIGAGIGQTILDGANVRTVLAVSGGNDTTVTLEGLTITRGKSTTAAGGISTSGNLTLRDVDITANHAERGGGILQLGGTLTLAAGTRVTGNSAILDVQSPAGIGGGICVFEGSVTLEAGTSVTQNTASDAGGGIWAFSQNAVTLEPGSTVSNNIQDNCEPNIGACT